MWACIDARFLVVSDICIAKHDRYFSRITDTAEAVVIFGLVRFVMADPTDAVGYAFPDEAVTYNKRDLILYALGIQATELHFTYENGQT
jgi:hypothetical protein